MSSIVNQPVEGDSTDQLTPGVKGTNSAPGAINFSVTVGVEGSSLHGIGVFGYTDSGMAGVNGQHSHAGIGVRGFSLNGTGVLGTSGFLGTGGSDSTSQDAGVVGLNEGTGSGIIGIGASGIGVSGTSSNGEGVFGLSYNRAGVFGKSQNWEGVHGETKSLTAAAIVGLQLNPAGTGAGIYAESQGTGAAGFFKGDVIVTGDIKLINADCAEDFDIIGLEKVEPGTVMVIDADGALRQSDRPYDKRVAGVISGAGNYKPGIVLDKQESSKNRMPIALMGKVYCKVDASYGAIEVGDLLTTSPTIGHGMKANDPLKAFGAVIGKALRPLDEGQGLIPILIALQ